MADLTQLTDEQLQLAIQSVIDETANEGITKEKIANILNSLNIRATTVKGWSPLLVADTSSAPGKSLIKLSDWIGGTGTKPTSYVGYWMKADGTYTNVLADAMELPKGADGKTIETWSAKEFSIGSSVYHAGKIFSNEILAALSTDVPNISPVWVEKLGNLKK